MCSSPRHCEGQDKINSTDSWEWDLRGGMGQVFRARDPQLARDVAIKVIRQGSGGTATAGEERARFLRETRAAARFRHDNVVAIVDVGDEDGVPFLVMELVFGRSLRAMVVATLSPPAAERRSARRRIRCLRMRSNEQDPCPLKR